MIPSETHLNRAIWPILPVEEIDWEATGRTFQQSLSENILIWSNVDETTDGRIQLTLDISAERPEDISNEAWSRVFCFLIVSRLNGQALNDACASLVDIYRWQNEQVQIAPKIPERRRQAVANVRRLEPTLFIYDEG